MNKQQFAKLIMQCIASVVTVPFLIIGFALRAAGEGIKYGWRLHEDINE